ncbi:MAG: PadR family transcriptional regulator [Thermoanaerobaculia bacterium]|nr:PadR family transcriptional regulator [Thermoanaerobaculia bacterium]
MNKENAIKERLGEFEELILLCVGGLGESAYAARIQQRLEEDVGRSAALGAIYAALDRLERKTFVRSWLGSPTAERGGRRKRFYAVTSGGVDALEQLRTARTLLWRRFEAELAGAQP